MPEGPSILILKEAVQFFKGELITEVSGNTKVNKDLLLNQVITDFKIWGKHFFNMHTKNQCKNTPYALGLI